MCKEAGCRKKPDRGNYCFRCLTRRARAKDPVKAAYWILKANAKRRGKVFTLTLDEWREFCVETEYIAGKGRTSKSASVDRKIEALGYTRENIQKLPLGENVKKYLNYCYQTKTAMVTTSVTNTEKIEWFDE